MISTRIATTNDAELIADMSRQTFYETFAPFNTKVNMEDFMNTVFTKQLLMKEVQNNEGIFLLAYDGNDAVGYVRMRHSEKMSEFKNAGAIEIARIYATTSSIGKGVGKALMKKCIEIAIEQKKEILWLGVWEHNQRAIDFYSKWGFEKFGTHIFKLGDDPQTDWLMKKNLTAVINDYIT